MDEVGIPNCRMSAEFDKLAQALTTAIADMDKASKDATNPHFKSKYADLTSINDVAKPALAKVGIAVLQPPSTREGCVVVTTILMHTSGQWIASELVMLPVNDTPQGIGSTITYARRYGLSGILGITAEDDDGNAGSLGQRREPPPKAQERARTNPPETREVIDDPELKRLLERANASASEGNDLLIGMFDKVEELSDKAQASAAWKKACATFGDPQKDEKAIIPVLRALYAQIVALRKIKGQKVADEIAGKK